MWGVTACRAAASAHGGSGDQDASAARLYVEADCTCHHHRWGLLRRAGTEERQTLVLHVGGDSCIHVGVAGSNPTLCNHRVTVAPRGCLAHSHLAMPLRAPGDSEGFEAFYLKVSQYASN